MKKIILLLILLLIPSINSKAIGKYDAFYEGLVIPNVYIKKEYDGKEEIERLKFIRRNSDNIFFYRLNMLEPILSNQEMIYYDSNQEEHLKLSKEDYKKLQLYASLGYFYGYNHRDTRWFGVTQYLIWKTLYKDINLTLMFDLANSKENYLETEVLELEKLVSSHFIKEKPEELKLNIGDTYSIQSKIDYPIYEYEVDNNILEITEDNHILNFKAIKSGKTKLIIYESNIKEVARAYVSDTQQYITKGDEVPRYHQREINIEVNKPLVLLKSNILVTKSSDKDEQQEKEKSSTEINYSINTEKSISDNKINNSEDIIVIDVPNTYSKKKFNNDYVYFGIALIGLCLYRKKEYEN